MGAVILVLRGISLAISDRKHTSFLVILSEVVHVTVGTSHGRRTLQTVMSVLKIGRLVARLAGPRLMLHVPEVAGKAFRAVELSESVGASAKEHVGELGWLFIDVDSAACKFTNAGRLIK